MIRPILILLATVSAAVAAALTALLTAGSAAAQPPCAAFDTCRYLPDPSYDGPLLPTWDVPGSYGGWTTLPVWCDPLAHQCRSYVPGSR